jgi:acetyl-CoA/propionyl-CoA carboxylase carboxyl transferase subunit
LFDPGTIEPATPGGPRGVDVARGDVLGNPAVAFATEPSLRGGAIGVVDCRRIVDAIDDGVRKGRPVVGLWHSGGARIDEGMAALDGVGSVFSAMVRASGRVPQISVVLGPAAGGAAYGPALTDIIIMTGAGRIFVTGPDVVRQVTGERVEMERLGGTEPHSRKSGLAHVISSGDRSAIETARDLVDVLGRPGILEPDTVADVDLLRYLPGNPGRGDAQGLVDALLDRPGIELHARWAPNVVTALGRFGGRAVGVVANNPDRLGGCIDGAGADKAARFVRMCDAFGLPVIVVVDVPGHLPGVGQEWDGIVRRGAKLVHAFAETVVPTVTLVTRKAYGGAYIALNSRALGATAVLAWPDAEIAMLGAPAAVDLLHRRTLAATPPGERERRRDELIRGHRANGGGLGQAFAAGAVDEVVAPGKTRSRIARILADTPAARGVHTNIPL